MDPKTLREHLETVHQELSAARQIEPGSNQLLGEIMADIKRLMDAGETPAPVAATTDDEPLPDRLERIAVQFEADHPTLAASSRRLVDLLGKVGL